MTNLINLHKYMKYLIVIDFDLADLAGEYEDAYDEVMRIGKLVRDNFSSMLYYGSEKYSFSNDWITSMFHSIKEIFCGKNGMFLLDLLPS